MSPAPCPLPVLSPEWFERVEKAAREVENVSGNGHSSVGLAALLADIAVLRKHYAPKESVAFAPSRLYKALRDLYPER